VCTRLLKYNNNDNNKEELVMSDLFGAGGSIVTMYPTPQSMANKVREYFDYCLPEVIDPRTGEMKIKERKPPTYSGLARYLGFQSRGQMLDYVNKRDEAYNTILADAKLRLEDYLEGKLVYSKAPTGIMFALKNNAGWEEKSTRQNAGDVIDTKASPVEKEGVLPPAPETVESTSDDGCC
jgi:hypothetical protein